MNDETLNEFVVTMEREGVNDRDDDRDDRDKSLENSDLKKIGKQGNDRDDRVKHAGVSYKALDGTQKNIIQFCSIPRSAREILEHIGYSYHPTHIAKFIKPLLKLGFIEMTEPDKPNSKNQKYRICQQGQVSDILVSFKKSSLSSRTETPGSVPISHNNYT